MNFDLNEWINLLLRWGHVFAGILWVGTTFYFTWLDGRFAELEEQKQSGAGGNEPPKKQVWMVHSGGFYVVEKLKKPNVLPGKLQWFRWEAALTWLTGILLFMLVYYHGRILVETEDSRISHATAMVLSVVLLAAGWLVYDVMWNSRLFANDKIGVTVSYALLVGITWSLFHFFASRAACLQLGAMLGTIMAANVWMRILPAQRRMVRALGQAQDPDPAEALRAKARSKHNTFIVLPVVFLMLSYHYPGTYRWWIVSLLILMGWGAARLLRRA